MKGLTLTQPWATMVALRAKHIETCSRAYFSRIASSIHARRLMPLSAAAARTCRANSISSDVTSSTISRGLRFPSAMRQSVPAYSMDIWYNCTQMKANAGQFKRGERRSPATEFKKGEHWRPHQRFREKDYLEREYVERKRSAAGQEVGCAWCVQSNVRQAWRTGTELEGRRDARAAGVQQQPGVEGSKRGRVRTGPGYLPALREAMG
jgi:hypothetical protein